MHTLRPVLFRVAAGALIFATPVVAQSASVQTFGNGCPNPAVVYELFPQTTIDLASLAFDFFPNGMGGYIVIPGASAYVPPAPGTDLMLGDDDLATGVLPFSFTHPGGVTSSVEVCSNGFVWLSPETSADFSPSVQEFLGEVSRIAPHWTDLNPTNGGTVNFEVVGTTEARITWDNVPEFGSTSAGVASVQIAMFASGQFTLRYVTVGATTHDILAGYSAGSAINDPGSVDLSAITALDLGSAGVPLELDAARGELPRLGRVFNYQIYSIPQSTALAFVGVGFTAVPGGQSLAAVGMPGCFRYVDFLSTGVIVPNGSTALFPLTIPNDPNLIGLVLNAQGAAIVPGANRANAITSNAVEITIGN